MHPAPVTRLAAILTGAALLLSALVLPANADTRDARDARDNRDTRQPAAGAASGVPEPFRPDYHFSPEENWLNDPNGLVFHDGEYHLFFQYNPEGDTWGNMSWGHAVSTDLVSWEQLPLAIAGSPEERIFSGGVVVDHENTSGFGEPGNPAMVAMYTSWYESGSGHQAQSLAYSLDNGRTWTKYEGNPVLRAEQDGFNPFEFRDPKVFWDEDEQKWVMSLALATDRKIAFYESDDLKDWDLLSTFGPAGATGGVWEVPDLFELPVDGDPEQSRWVLVVNLNPGAIAGGSGAQYFVGDWDGTTFTPDDDQPYSPPVGDLLADFEGDTYGEGWQTTGEAFGTGPAQGTLPGQQTVTGYLGDGLVNSFLGGDGPQGTLTSPEFTIDRDFINLLVGGGPHPWVPGTGDGSPPDGTLLEDFEDGWDGWDLTGSSFGAAPTAGNAACQGGVNGYLGERLANSFHNGGGDPCTPPPDSGTGTATSAPFTVTDDHISFLIGGGAHAATSLRLLVDGEPVRSTSGRESGTLDWRSWDVSELRGQEVRLQIVDGETGGWGHVMVDHVVMGPEPAEPRSQETAVNLLVDDEVVRTSSGQEAEALDWVAWDVSDLQGSVARIQVVDRNSGGWGHINVDHIMLADEAATSSLERAGWLDFGRDYYAAVSWEDQPQGKRYMIAWMNNWQYANQVPTSPWRGQMTLPREMSLVTTRDGEVVLSQQPVPAARARTARPLGVLGTRRVDDQQVTVLPGVAADVARLDVRLDMGDADRAGVVVHAGDDGEGTLVGYDATTGELFVDRRRSGQVGFNPTFASVEHAPLAVRDGRVRFSVYLDRSSVEVFSDDGTATITDLVFPSVGSDGLRLFAEGGAARFTAVRVDPGPTG